MSTQWDMSASMRPNYWQPPQQTGWYDWRNAEANPSNAWNSTTYSGDANYAWNSNGHPNYAWNSNGDPNYAWNNSGDANYAWNSSGDPNYAWNSSSDPNYAWNSSGHANHAWNSSSDPNYAWNSSGHANHAWNSSGDPNYAGNSSSGANHAWNSSGDPNYASNGSGHANHAWNSSGDPNYAWNSSSGANYAWNSSGFASYGWNNTAYSGDANNAWNSTAYSGDYGSRDNHSCNANNHSNGSRESSGHYSEQGHGYGKGDSHLAGSARNSNDSNNSEHDKVAGGNSSDGVKNRVNKKVFFDSYDKGDGHGETGDRNKIDNNSSEHGSVAVHDSFKGVKVEEEVFSNDNEKADGQVNKKADGHGGESEHKSTDKDSKRGNVTIHSRYKLVRKEKVLSGKVEEPDLNGKEGDCNKKGSSNSNNKGSSINNNSNSSCNKNGSSNSNNNGSSNCNNSGSSGNVTTHIKFKWIKKHAALSGKVEKSDLNGKEGNCNNNGNSSDRNNSSKKTGRTPLSKLEPSGNNWALVPCSTLDKNANWEDDGNYTDRPESLGMGKGVYLETSHIDFLMCMAVSGQSKDELISRCEAALLASDVNNVTESYLIAAKYGLQRVMDHLIQLIRDNFVAVTQTRQFLELPVDLVELFLSDTFVNVGDELDVFSTALRWIDYNKQERLCLAGRVLNCVRYEKIQPIDIRDHIEPNIHLFNGPCGPEALVNIYRKHALAHSGVDDGGPLGPRVAADPNDIPGGGTRASDASAPAPGAGAATAAAPAAANTGKKIKVAGKPQRGRGGKNTNVSRKDSTIAAAGVLPSAGAQVRWKNWSASNCATAPYPTGCRGGSSSSQRSLGRIPGTPAVVRGSYMAHRYTQPATEGHWSADDQSTQPAWETETNPGFPHSVIVDQDTSSDYQDPAEGTSRGRDRHRTWQPGVPRPHDHQVPGDHYHTHNQRRGQGRHVLRGYYNSPGTVQSQVYNSDRTFEEGQY